MEFEINKKKSNSPSSAQVVKDSHSQSSINLECDFQNPEAYGEDPFLNKNLIAVDEDNLPF